MRRVGLFRMVMATGLAGSSLLATGLSATLSVAPAVATGQPAPNGITFIEAGAPGPAMTAIEHGARHAGATAIEY